MHVRRLILAGLLGTVLTAGSRAAAPTPIERLRALAGEWQLLDTQGEPCGLRATYRVIAAGAGVTEAMFVGTDEETVTTYHIEDGLVTATQIAAGRRPARLVPARSEDPETLRFEVDGAAGPLREIVLTRTDADTLRVTWTHGVEDGSTTLRAMRLRRLTEPEDLSAEVVRLRADLTALEEALDRRLKDEVQVEAGGPRPVRRREIRTIPTDDRWDVSGTPLRLFLHKQERRFASTYASDGDEGQTIAHFPFRAGPNCHVNFAVLGGHAYFAVVEETKVPPRRIQSLPDFEKKLGGGEYGVVVERIVGERWNDFPVSVDWDLSRFAGKQMRLYLVDVVSNHFGQIAISEISITEDAPR